MNTIANPLDPAHPLPAKSLVLVGMPGSGKSSIGRRLAARLALPFVDSDTEVETAAGMTIEQIFDRFGEAEFRAVERRVISRLLNESPHVISTGGGAFINEEIRAMIKEKATSIWLKVDIEILFDRISRRADRPLLKGDGDEPRIKLEKLKEIREETYAMADITVESDHRPAEETVTRVLEALSSRGQMTGIRYQKKE
ncbi:MAG: shikimate kinase [Alphaproteobacteria bacterium]|nr:shikimate kinase [Alphaproteobacteria bacterium]